MRRKGQEAEGIAESFLIEAGLSPIKRNYYCKCGEIDLIMSDKESLVFVEVRFRNNTDHGTPLESITSSKQRKIIRAAKNYLTRYHLWDRQCRIDAIGIDKKKDGSLHFDWQKNAICE
ncbi:MAG: YraN family protein [Gammaproteobacteria bacterium]|nr:MAG: YraN family protein [Pseudomonadota bacterium]PIE38518.1 MAG: YraN family protein [Gammaproteobacteria bacterium]